jgi:hypothetical protein
MSDYHDRSMGPGALDRYIRDYGEDQFALDNNKPRVFEDANYRKSDEDGHCGVCDNMVECGINWCSKWERTVSYCCTCDMFRYS